MFVSCVRQLRYKCGAGSCLCHVFVILMVHDYHRCHASTYKDPHTEKHTKTHTETHIDTHTDTHIDTHTRISEHTFIGKYMKECNDIRIKIYRKVCLGLIYTMFSGILCLASLQSS